MAGSIEGHVLCVIVCERKAGQWLDGRQPFPYRIMQVARDSTGMRSGQPWDYFRLARHSGRTAANTVSGPEKCTSEIVLKAAAGILDWGGLGIFDLSQPSCATQPHHNDQQSAEETTLRTDSTAG